MARAPTIGITVSLDPGVRIRPGADYLYVGRAYARAVHEAGGLPLLVPPDADPAAAVRACDAFVLTGGDMLPAALDGSPAPDAVGPAESAARVAWDRRLLDGALGAGRPLLGVCYGMQLLNLHAGGTLRHDLADEPPAGGARVDHGGNGRLAAHPVAAHPGTALAGLLAPGARVASSHRQGIDRVAPGFRASAAAPDGVVEAIEPEAGGAVLGVLWHPESDATAAAVYGWLVRSARERA